MSLGGVWWDWVKSGQVGSIWVASGGGDYVQVVTVRVEWV